MESCGFVFLIVITALLLPICVTLDLQNGNDNMKFINVGNNSITDPEAFMTVDETIRYHGYPVEDYDIQTDDGYIIRIQRIPYGKTGKDNKRRTPVLIQHGISCNSGIWLSNPPEKNLPYILVDKGYDVWLGNIRGNKFGRKHVTLTPDDEKFWDFSYDEMAKYDIPKVIDTMLDVTGFNHIYYIGHSMGTTIAFVLLSTQPKYNHIVKGVLALAPVTAPVHMTGIFRYVGTFTYKFFPMLQALGIRRFAVNVPINILTRTLCTGTTTVKNFCRSSVFTTTGDDYAQFNMSRFQVMFRHNPDTTSVQTVAHFGQTIELRKFQFQDFGKETNFKKYGQATPPDYDLSKIKSPVALFWSDNDVFSTPQDIPAITSQIKSIVLSYRVPFKKFTHLDFNWAMDVKPLLYDKVVSVMEKMDRGEKFNNN